MIDAIVTGAGGFIGRRLVERLETLGKKVLPVTRQEGDICDPQFWNALPAASTLFHLAGRSYVPDSWSDNVNFMNANVLGTQQALNWCKGNGADIVFASAYVYGQPQRLPINEDHPLRPNNPYALSKCLAEQLCEFATEHDNLSVTALRLFNVYGAGQRPEFLIPTILKQIASKSEITVMDLEPRRDYVYVEDVISAFLSAIDAPSGYNCINIGSGVSLSVREIVEIAQSVCGTSLPVSSACLGRRNELPDVRADIFRAKTLLGWHPKWEFAAGIQDMMKEL